VAHPSGAGRTKSFWKRFNEVVPTWIQAVCAIAAIVLTILAATGTFSSSPSTIKSGPLVVQDAYQGGVWTRTRPEPGPLPAQQDRPANGVAWIQNKTVLTPLCAEAASPYPVKNDGKNQIWRWWAQLHNRSWMPMAAFQETSVDGAYNLPAC
jgi:hypothetical protein